MTINRRKEKSRSSWQSMASFPQSFSYEVDAPLKDVVQSLTELEQEPRLFRRTTAQEVSVLPAGDEYFFRVRHRRHGTITATAEGHLYQDETGCTIVEGETRLNGWSMITPLVAVGALGFGFLLPFLTTPIPFAFPLMLFIMSMLAGSVLSWLTYTRDRRKLEAQLHEIVTGLQEQDADKRKRHARLSLDDEAVEQATIWSEDPAPKQEKRL
jgi:hypothetical protein